MSKIIMYICAAFAVLCLATAVIYGAWWHIGTALMSGVLAWAHYADEKE